MSTTQERYAELVALAQLYLFQEYPAGSWTSTDADTFQYFKTYALQNQQKRPPAPAPALQQPAPAPMPRPMPAPAAVQPLPAAAIPDQPPQPASPPEIESLQPPPEARPAAAPATDATEPAKKAPKAASQKFVLEPMEEAPPLDYSDLKKIFTEKFPAVEWLETPPSDAAAKEQAKHKPAEIIILSYNESGKQLAFLQNLSNAINTAIGPVEIISAATVERGNDWDQLLKGKNLRLVITSYAGAQTLPGLMKHFKESPKQGLHHLGKIPLCLLSDIGIYLREPRFKLPLWQSIQALLHHGK